MFARKCDLLLLGASSTGRRLSALVDSKWVRSAQISDNPALLIFDCNHPSLYHCGHIPDAIPLPLATSLLKDPTPASTGVVSSRIFVDAVKKLRISNDITLVFYDDELSLKSTRMWWVFRHYGYPLEQLKVLDGGLKQWQADGNAVETGNSKDRERQATPWTQVKNLHKLVGFEAVQKGIADPLTQFVDARSPDEFNGRVADGNSRSGHVPGAMNFDWSNSMNILQNGKFYKKEVLDKVFCDSCHLDKDKPVITYCQRGIRAAHLAFALEQISGFKDVKVYEDSMLQYLNREDTEVA